MLTPSLLQNRREAWSSPLLWGFFFALPLQSHQSRNGSRTDESPLCAFLSPNDLHVEYSNAVEIKLAIPPGGSSKQIFSIVLDGGRVGQNVRCPATFTLRGLLPGTHSLAIVPVDEGNEPGGAQLAFCVSLLISLLAPLSPHVPNLSLPGSRLTLKIAW